MFISGICNNNFSRGDTWLRAHSSNLLNSKGQPTVLHYADADYLLAMFAWIISRCVLCFAGNNNKFSSGYTIDAPHYVLNMTYSLWINLSFLKYMYNENDISKIFLGCVCVFVQNSMFQRLCSAYAMKVKSSFFAYTIFQGSTLWAEEIFTWTWVIQN